MARLTDVEVTDALAQLPGWGRRADRIEKELVFPTFPDLIAFLVRLAFEAEAADHHPDAAIHYRRLTVTYWTHSEGGITAKDVQGATMVERLLGETGHR